MIAIFDRESDAVAYVAQVNDARGYPRPGTPPATYPYGWTLTHATPRKHPTLSLWAVELADGIEAVDAVDLEEQLGDAWEPEVTP